MTTALLFGSFVYFEFKMMEIPAPAVAAIDGAIEFVYSFQPLAEKTVFLGKINVEPSWMSTMLSTVNFVASSV